MSAASCRAAGRTVLVLACLAALVQPVRAAPAAPAGLFNGAPTAPELAGLGAQLVAADEALRQQAYGALRGLPATSLPAIQERFAAIAAERIQTDAWTDALAAFRRAMGSTRADDNIDLAPGILRVAATDRRRTTALIAEALLLLRSLEAIGTAEAGLLVAEGLALAPEAFAQESNRIRERVGIRLVPAWIALRSHRVPEIRRWAARSLRALNVTDAVTALQHHDPAHVAAVLRAYGQIHELDAVPATVAALNDHRVVVRSAAREAVREFGRNAIWRLRVAFQEATGRSADAGWDAERTLNELCLVFDRQRIERAETALALGLKAHLAGDLERMEHHFAVALRVDPALPRRSDAGPGFAALGEARLAADDLPRAEDAFRRALRLSPKHYDAERWRANLEYVRAERALARGIVDMPGYTAAVASDSSHQGAAEALDRLSGAWSARAERNRRLSALCAIALLCACGIGVLRLRRRPQAASSPAIAPHA